tara:strand:- start:47 stop:703 length:657 start_codon:yes stop_codon:yes gene_type:complete
MTGKLPPTASVADALGGGKLHAPAAARNAGMLCAALAQYGPAKGRALEIASGTGQHVTAFAGALPGLRWQPTEIDAARRISVDAHTAEAGLTNVAPAIALDACTAGWGATHAGQDLIVLVNLLHLVTAPKVRTLIAEVAKALTPGGAFMVYGPFKRNGELTSAGDVRFDAELRGADPGTGYKDDKDIANWLSKAGLTLHHRIEMPANNLLFIARKAKP